MNVNLSDGLEMVSLPLRKSLAYVNMCTGKMATIVECPAEVVGGQ